MIMAAGERPTFEGTKLALELGSDVNAADRNGNTALHAAASLAFSTVVQLLVDHGAKLDVKNKAGRAPQDLICRDRAGKLVRPVGTVTPACPDPNR